MEAVLRALSAVLCLSQAFLPSCTYASLAFLSEPLSATERLGGMVHLRCSAHPPSARLSWRFRGQPLKDPGSSVAVLLQSPGHLTLPSVQPDQAGDYQCVAESEAGAIASRLARVTIAGISKFDKSHRRSVTVEEGSTALIECHLPPSEPPALPLVWVRGARLDQSTDEFLILPSGNLQIVSATTQHQGMYKCTAYNPITQEFRSEAQRTKLTVKRSSAPSPVRIVYPLTPQTLVVALSGSLTLECVLAGSPPPVARWTKDGEEVVPGPRHTLLYNNLVLTGVRRSDAGSYRCSAQADGGDVISTDYTVSVHEPASVMEGLMDQSVPPGSSVLFSCLADGNPTPNITWLLNSTPVVPSPRLQISGPSLHIADVVLGDQGVYQCLLDNGISSAQSSGILTVQSGLDSEPVILSPPVSGRFQEGDFVSLSCNASGDPLPDIRWYDTTGAVIAHPSHLLQPHKATAEASGDGSAYVAMSRPGSSSLYIQAVAPYHAGKYICMASNKLGSVQAEAFLSVVPPMSTTASVAVSLPSASAYPIQNNVGEESSLPEEELEDLQAMSTERTGYLPTPEAPIITSPPQTYKHDVYDLEWRAGRDWGNPINAYFVKYRKLDDVGNVAGGWHTVRVPGSEKSLHLSELEPSSLYEVLMVARSSAGDGQPAMLTFRTGKERGTSSSKAPPEALPDNTPEQEISNTHQVKQDRVPEAPDRPTISMATESSAYVTWIPRANGGSPITEFRVEFRRQGRSAEWAVAADNISPLKLSVEVRRLEPGSTYRFRVVAMNLYGESPPSAASKAYQVSPVSPPFSTRPVAGPHISTTDAVSDTQIMLRWTYTPSSNNNTPIQGFYIYYRPTDSDNDSDYKRDVVEGNKQWHLIGQLQPETSYDIKMQCFNSGGPSEYSNVMICETKARQALGVAPQNPVASPGPSLSEPSMPPGGLLYLIVGSVLGLMVLILLAFIGMCLWRNRQQGSLSKYDPPGYLCQTAEMNGRALEYGSLRVAGGCMQNGLQPTPSCPHLHHKPPASVALLNGPHTHHSPMEYEHSHAHHLHNGGGMYTALSQSESSDCTSCQNFCNNNRCYTKKNGTFTASTLAIMRYVAPRQPDGLEMVPLAPVMSHCQRPAEDGGGGGAGEPVGDTEGKTVPPPSHLPYRQAGENRHCALEEGALPPHFPLFPLPVQALDMVARYGTPERPALC